MTSSRQLDYIIRDEAIRKRLVSEIMALDLSKPWRAEIKPYRKRRSRSQQGLQWAWMNFVAQIIGDETGNDAEDIHAFYKARYCPAKAVELGGQWAEHKSTAALDTAEMTAYLDAVYRHAVTELGHPANAGGVVRGRWRYGAAGGTTEVVMSKIEELRDKIRDLERDLTLAKAKLSGEIATHGLEECGLKAGDVVSYLDRHIEPKVGIVMRAEMNKELLGINIVVQPASEKTYEPMRRRKVDSLQAAYVKKIDRAAKNMLT